MSKLHQSHHLTSGKIHSVFHWVWIFWQISSIKTSEKNSFSAYDQLWKSASTHRLWRQLTTDTTSLSELLLQDQMLPWKHSSRKTLQKALGEMLWLVQCTQTPWLCHFCPSASARGGLLSSLQELGRMCWADVRNNKLAEEEIKQILVTEQTLNWKVSYNNQIIIYL